MRETHVSEWTPAAYWAREERRRQAIKEDAAQTDLTEILQSDWTLPAFQAREVERAREEGLKAAVPKAEPATAPVRPLPAPTRESVLPSQPVFLATGLFLPFRRAKPNDWPVRSPRRVSTKL